MSLRTQFVLHAAPVLSGVLVLSGCGESAPPPPKVTVTELQRPLAAEGTTVTVPNATAAIAAAMEQFEVKPDPDKYPQETPQKAMESLAKALESNDLAYQIAWLTTPDFATRMIEKYKSIKACVEANQTPEKVAGRKALLDTIRKMQAGNVTKEGEENGTKWFAYRLGEEQVVEFELQKNKRWCWNPKARSAKK